MAFTSKELNKKIDAFLTRACAGGILGISKKGDLILLLNEPDPSDADAVWSVLNNQKKRFVAWLGLTRRTAGVGAAGSIDNLLVLINGFVLLFVIVALVPVLFLYRSATWIIPVALFCPLVHFLAFRLARNPGVRKSRTKNMHLFAAVTSIIPFLCIAGFVTGIARVPGLGHKLMAGAVCLWLIHVLVVAILIRTGGGFYWALFLSAIVASAWLVWLGDGFAETACLHLLIAFFLYGLAGWAARTDCALSSREMHGVAGFFLTTAFAGLGLFLLHGSQPAAAHFAIALSLFAASLALLPMAAAGEDARLANIRVKIGWKILLAGTWLFFGLALLARGAFGIQGLAAPGGSAPRLLFYAFLIIALAWSLLLLYEQFVATSDFSPNIFSFASFVLLACLFSGYVALAAMLSYFVAMLLAVGVCFITSRLSGRYRASFRPEAGRPPVAAGNEPVARPEPEGEDGDFV